MSDPATTEAAALLRYLDSQRNHVLGMLDGLDDEALHHAVLPSGWCCASLLGHLIYDVEHFWFRAVVAGEEQAIAALETNPGGWQIGEQTPVADLITAYRQAAERTNAIISTTPLDAAPAWWPAELFGDFRLTTVREVVLHMLTETATHAGHLDAVRELIDGRQWLVLAE